jgi:transposase InsO family protein
MALRSAVQAIVIEHRWHYGYRRVTEELRPRGITVNHKRIARIMQQDDLLAVRREWSRPGQQDIEAVLVLGRHGGKGPDS